MPSTPLRTYADPKHFHRRFHCELCDGRFGVLFGRHHCRYCCRTVCSEHFRRPLCSACDLDRLEALQRRVSSRREAAIAEVLSNDLEAATSDDIVADKGEAKKIPPGTEEVKLCKDVYATAFTLANNATPGMYSFNPFVNRDMLLVWFYLGFITFSQLFVLATLLFLNPPVVDSHSTFVDCAAPGVLAQELEWASFRERRSTREHIYSSLFGGGAGAQLPPGTSDGSLSAEALAHCELLELGFVSDGGVRYRRFESSTYYYENIFREDPEKIVLQLVCCVWVTVQVFFVDFTNVAALLSFRDFIRWLLPIKGEALRPNSWVMAIPMLQYSLACAVVAVSCCVTCGYREGFDIVLNSMAFTFISQVAQAFNQPLLKYYANKRIEGLDPAEYGSEPIYYLVSEYSVNNATDDYDMSWYVRDEDMYAGLLTDFHFRHNPDDYPRPWQRAVKFLGPLFFTVPFVATGLCYFLFAREL